MLDFPADPTSGQLFKSWTWDGEKWVAKGAVYIPEAPLDGALYGRESATWRQPVQSDLTDWPSSGYLPLTGGMLEGHLGIGVVPPAGQTPPSATGGWMFGWGVTINNWANNAYYDGENWRYQNDGEMWSQQMAGGSWSVAYAPDGVADAIASPTPFFQIGPDGAATVYGALTVNDVETCNSRLDVNAGSNLKGTVTIYPTAGYINQAGGGSFMVQTQGGEAFVTYHVPGSFACNFGLAANGYFYIGGWSLGSGNLYQMWTSRDFANPACDYRIKADIVSLPSMWDRVKALKPVRYRQREFSWPNAPKDAPSLIEQDGAERWGFLAHELQETLVERAATGVKDDPDVLQSPNLMLVVAALTKTLQEAQIRIEALEGAR
jgi:hypothetical protein